MSSNNVSSGGKQHQGGAGGGRAWATTGARPRVPSTPHAAYCAGLEAARQGKNLAKVVHSVLEGWPADRGLAELAEIVTCTSLGYWTRRTEGGAR